MTTTSQSIVSGGQILLVLENFALGTDGATVTADSTATGGNLVANNLLDDRLDSAWRSGSVATAAAASDNFNVVWTLGGARPVDWVSIHRHNLRMPFKVHLYKAVPPADPEVSSEWIDPIVKGRLEDYEWKSMPWELGPRTRDLELWQETFRLDSFVKFDDVYYGITHVGLEIDTSSGDNRDYDYVQIGHPFIAESFQPNYYMTLNWALGGEDRSEIHRADDGSIGGRRRSFGRTITFSLDYAERSEAFQKIFTYGVKKLGTLGRLFVMPEPTQRRYFYDLSMVCTITQIPKAQMIHLDLPGATGWVLTETE